MVLEAMDVVCRQVAVCKNDQKCILVPPSWWRACNAPGLQSCPEASVIKLSKDWAVQNCRDQSHESTYKSYYKSSESLFASSFQSGVSVKNQEYPVWERH